MIKKTGLKSMLVILIMVFVAGTAFAQDYDKLLKSTIDNLNWRNLGPAIMGGRIDDFAVDETNPFVIYCATASGGLWKTTNNGVTWEPIFDDQVTSTIGCVSLAPTNSEIVWVGTGEPNNRQSSSWGNGVYRSNDGGKTWMHMGLENTHTIARVVIDHKNPDVVYVGAVGHLWGPNRQRGVYKTTDGGKTWTNVLFVDKNTGCIDLRIDPENNEILYAAMYQRRRRGWGFIGGGPGSGLYKTIDGGKTWTKLTKDLPEGDTGRIGINVYRKDSRIVYAVIENKNGGVFRSEDKGETWMKMSDTNPRPMYYSKIRIDPNNDQRIWVLGARMYTSYDGGKTFKTDVVTRVHGDHHAMWINPANSNHMIIGSDGGVYFSYDRGMTWDFVNTFPICQFYEIGYDMRKPYNVYGGLQDNGSWMGPSETRTRIGITNCEWKRVGGGDGFYTQVDPNDPNILYVESQNGYLNRMNLYTKETKMIRPEPEDEDETYRFNWNSPVLISPHNSNTIYYGGNKLFRSTNRGDTWTASPDLTKQMDRDKMEIMGIVADEGTLSKHDGIAYYGDIITIAESPVREGILWVGTDDGNVQLSKDGGVTWKNLIDNFFGVPDYTYVSRIEASHFSESRAYVTMDGHRNDDYKPYVFVTEDFGKTWKSIADGIPYGSTVNVIREHFRNPNLLFIGTERGAYFSIDRGSTWIKFEGDIPIVPVDDIIIHPRENDLLFGTHGRGIWILDDITSLEQLSKTVLASDAYLFKTRPATRFQYYNSKGSTGHKIYIAPNPEFGALITYYLNCDLDKKDKVKITVTDKEGNKIRKIDGTRKKGFNRINWDLRYEPPFEGEGRYAPSGPFVIPGEYVLTLEVKDNTFSTPVNVVMDERIKVSRHALIAQRDLALKLSKMYGKGYKANQKIEDLEKQINNLKEYLKSVEDLDETVTNDIDALSKKLDDIKTRIMGSRERDVRGIYRNISGLMGNIMSYTAAPTEKQLKEADEFGAKLEAILSDLDDLLKTDVPELNRKMHDKDIPFINVKK